MLPSRTSFKGTKLVKKIITLGLLLAFSNNSFTQDLMIINGRIIDGNGGFIERGAVAISDGRIISVSASPQNITNPVLIDAEGMTVMPGLIDAHRHVIQAENPNEWLDEEAANRMAEFLNAGFTTVLSAGDPLEAILELRRRLEENEINGPRLLVSGRVPLSATPSGFSPGVDPARVDISRPPDRPQNRGIAIPEKETRAAVRTLVSAGVDAIKTVIIVTPDGPEQQTLAVVASEARDLGVLSITHAVTVQDTVAAVEAETSVLVHTPHIGQLDQNSAQMIARAGIPMMSTLGIFVPTFAAENQRIRTRTGSDNVARFRDLEPFPMNTLSSAGQGPVNARFLWEAGITYGYGSDTTFLPKDSLAHELKPLRLVFSAQDIITIMTRHSAASIGRLHELGTLEPGKFADIVLIDGNPLENTADLLNISVVIKNGEVVADHR